MARSRPPVPECPSGREGVEEGEPALAATCCWAVPLTRQHHDAQTFTPVLYKIGEVRNCTAGSLWLQSVSRIVGSWAPACPVQRQSPSSHFAYISRRITI